MFLIVIAVTFGASLLIQTWLKRTYARWQIVPNASGATGAQVARHILDSNGLQKVRLEMVKGTLSDHYIPSQELIRLSDAVYNQPSVASIAIAGHEVGHALQKASHYGPLKLKSVLMPMAAAASQGGMIMALGGSFIGMPGIAQIGTILFVSAMGIQVLALPIEFDASKRALHELQSRGLVDEKDVSGARSVLRAAALTYVASAATSLAFMAVMALQLFGRRGGR